MPSRTIDDVLKGLPQGANQLSILPAPPYKPAMSQEASIVEANCKVGLAVESMKHHMTDEGWAIFKGLEQNGWKLYGHGLPLSITSVPTILSKMPDGGTLLIQDEREWDVAPKDFRDQRARFFNPEALNRRDDIFKLTILKDAHQRGMYHRESANKMRIHAWVIYYNPRIVKHVAPWVREEHLIRTWHSINPNNVPEFTSAPRRGCLLSGAVSAAYPLRRRLVEGSFMLPDTVVLPHPGYHRGGCFTPSFLIQLSKFKVAICTSSCFGYALRKIPEATAAGCIVLTDLPADEVMPGGIDENLVRITSDFNVRRVGNILRELYESYDTEKQAMFSERAKSWYSESMVGKRLSDDIEALRMKYNG